MGALKIGADATGRFAVSSQFEKDRDINENEKKIAEHFLSVIKETEPGVIVSIERRARAYLSLCYEGGDFLRFKYTDRARWLSIDSWAVKLSVDDPRFIDQENKKARHWKATLSDLSDISKFDDLVIAACR